MVRLDVIIIFRSVSSFKKSEIGSKLQEHFRETLNQALRKPFYIIKRYRTPCGKQFTILRFHALSWSNSINGRGSNFLISTARVRCVATNNRFPRGKYTILRFRALSGSNSVNCRGSIFINSMTRVGCVATNL